MARWIIVSGEYAPQPGGVADYTYQVAEALISAGDTVTVFAPGRNIVELPGEATVVRLPSGYDLRGLWRLRAALRRSGDDCRVLVQFVAQAFGMRAVNIPLGIVLAEASRRVPLWVMFHEFAMLADPGLSRMRNLQAYGTQLLASIFATSAARVFVSTSAWIPRVLRVAPRARIDVCPIPSNVSIRVDTADVTRWRSNISTLKTMVVGHFGTYRMADSRAFLELLVPSILERTDAVVQMIGRDSDGFADQLKRAAPRFASRIIATGALPPAEIAIAIAACDVLVQPYGEGVTTRRGSLLGGLALGVPTITTMGPLSERIWNNCKGAEFTNPNDVSAMADAVSRLLDDPARRKCMSDEAVIFYCENFALAKTIDALRSR